MADALSKGALSSPRGHRLSGDGSPRAAVAGKTCCSVSYPPPSSPPAEALRSSFSGYFHGGQVVVRGEEGVWPVKGGLQTVPVQVSRYPQNLRAQRCSLSLSLAPPPPTTTATNRLFFHLVDRVDTYVVVVGFVNVQMSLRVGKAMKWWEKGVQPNMKEIHSAQYLADSLLNAGNKLVIVDFFSPGCGGCKALHPKICQLAEMNPDVQFLQINYEEHKSMCYSLNVHVLPFFRFYRGAQGRLCSFSCTNATVKKFKDALVKHSTERCSLGPARGLEESELVALAANKDLSFTYEKRPDPVPAPSQAPESLSRALKLPFSSSPKMTTQELVEKSVVEAGR